jgi:hypothetical protein
MQKVRGQEVGHDYVERRLLALGARPLRAGVRPAGWLTDALNDIRAVRLWHGGCLRYAMLTSTFARRRVRIQLPGTSRRGATVAVGTPGRLARAGITGVPYPKHVDPPPAHRPTRS